MLTPDHHMNDDMLVSYLLDEADEPTRRQVEDWIVESHENRRYYEHFRLVWETSTVLAGKINVDEDAAWQRFRQRIVPDTSTRPASPVIQMKKYAALYRVAASVILIAGVLGVFYSVWQKNLSAPVTVVSNSASVTETLPDGSVITLNKASSIRYRGNLSGGQRKIKLEGEAFFDVRPDSSRPFVVDVNDITITVLGTSFNVKEADGKTEVIVATGKVRVERAESSITLTKDEKVTISDNDTVFQKSASGDKLYNYYRTKEFVCDNTPLWKLVQVLNEAYDVNIVIGNDELKDLPLTTTFHNESLENILSIIRETFGIAVEYEGSNIILK